MKLRNKKTGEITDLAKRGLLKSDNDNHIIVYPEGTLKYYAYNSLAELNEEWEDYKPKEPLIRDKNTREAVRAWAEVNSIEKALYAERTDRSLCLLTDMGEDDYNIDFVGWIPTLKDGEDYTITELCGEEKK